MAMFMAGTPKVAGDNGVLLARIMPGACPAPEMPFG
jgi:hypothetical protein